MFLNMQENRVSSSSGLIVKDPSYVPRLQIERYLELFEKQSPIIPLNQQTRLEEPLLVAIAKHIEISPCKLREKVLLYLCKSLLRLLDHETDYYLSLKESIRCIEEYTELHKKKRKKKRKVSILKKKKISRDINSNRPSSSSSSSFYHLKDREFSIYLFELCNLYKSSISQNSSSSFSTALFSWSVNSSVWNKKVSTKENVTQTMLHFVKQNLLALKNREAENIVFISLLCRMMRVNTVCFDSSSIEIFNSVGDRITDERKVVSFLSHNLVNIYVMKWCNTLNVSTLLQSPRRYISSSQVYSPSKMVLICHQEEDTKTHSFSKTQTPFFKYVSKSSMIQTHFCVIPSSVTDEDILICYDTQDVHPFDTNKKTVGDLFISVASVSVQDSGSPRLLHVKDVKVYAENMKPVSTSFIYKLSFYAKDEKRTSYSSSSFDGKEEKYRKTFSSQSNYLIILVGLCSVTNVHQFVQSEFQCIINN